MHLSKIELFGFKSFPQKVELQFNKGITAIVGPNGSGKSNIVDAVRWVLGEQSAKSLRGSKMEDVIFSGTDDRKPLGYCEVGLVIDNDDGKLNLDFSEVNVTRRVYRSGESEYFINRNTCRLKDIIDLFRDTGIGNDGYSVVGQGKVDEILSTKSEDRRSVFEEAAGVTRYKARKDEAERKLSHTRDNLVRIDDILSELNSQMETLGSQSEAAKQFLALRDELKDIELNAFLRQYESLTKRIDDNILAREQRITEQNEAKEKESLLAAERREKNAELRALETSISQMQHSAMQLSGYVEKQDGETKLINEKIESFLRENRSYEERASEFSQKQEQLANNNHEFSNSLAQKRAEQDSVLLELKQIESKLEECSSRLSIQEEQYEQRKNSAMEYMNRKADAQSNQARLTTMRAGLLSRKQTVEETIQKQQTEQEELNRDYQKLQFEHESQQAKYQAGKKFIGELRAQAQDYSLQLAAFDANLQEKVRQIDRLHSRINVLSEMKREHEGYYDSVRKLLNDTAKTPALRNGVIGVVGEIIKVPPELETAIESALGATLQNIVVEDEQSAKRAIEHLRSNNYGRATFLPLTSVKSRTLNNNEFMSLNMKGVVGVASRLMSFDAKYTGIVENLLGRTVIVENMEAGITIARRNSNSFKITTLGGDLINVGGSMTGGSISKREFSLLGRDRELVEIKKRQRELEEEVAGSTQQKADLQHKLEEVQSRLSLAEEQVHNLEIEAAAQKERFETVEMLYKKSADNLKNSGLEIEQIEESVADIDARLSEFNSLGEGEQITQQELAILGEAVAKIRSQREYIMEQATSLKISLASIEKEVVSLEENISRIENEKIMLKKQVEQSRTAISANIQEIARLKAAFAQINTAKDTDRKAMDEQLEELHAAEQSRDQLQEHLEALDEQLLELQSTVNGYVERLHKIELQTGKFESDLENLQARIWDDYQLTYEGASQYRSDKSLSVSAARTEELKTLMRELGDVNVNAINDYKNIKERYDNLTTQKEDLTKAENDLCSMIAELMKTMEVLFKEQFEKIDENFGIVFRQLFGGGSAGLKLADKKDVLNCDIEINAQPPGKRLQHLSLLSGGEKALTAIALLFAMLKLKPTPFCLLDEIDAALDEANVASFAHFLKQYTDNTQFILVTHRKGSMEMSDSLYGVAMEEKGVSRLVSVKISDYARNA